jgi:hypothetical protein
MQRWFVSCKNVPLVRISRESILVPHDTGSTSRKKNVSTKFEIAVSGKYDSIFEFIHFTFNKDIY